MDQQKKVNKTGKRVSSWLKNSVSNPTIERIHYLEAKKDLHTFINGDVSDIVLVPRRVNSLGFWNLIHYENDVVNKKIYSFDMLASATKYYIYRVYFVNAIVPTGKGVSLLKSDAAFIFSLPIILGWKEQANKLGDLLLNGINNRLLNVLISKGGEGGSIFKHFWLLIHLFIISSDKKPIDITLYSYPESMSPYDEVLLDWNTQDLEKVNDFVSRMADYHMTQVKVPAHDEIFEFDYEYRMLFPYEILAYLRIREWCGLTNPTSFDHPLMQYPLAKMPDEPVAIPENPLLDQVIEVFKREFPGNYS